MGEHKLLRRLSIGVFVLVVLGAAGLLAAIWMTREPAPSPLTGQRIFAASRPAVPLVQADFDVKSSVPEPTIPKAKQNQITNQLIRMVVAGQVADNQAAIDAAAVKILIGNPDAYYEPGSKRWTDEFQLVGTGSGFFVNQDGYIVTAAHVVSPKKDDIRAEVLQLAQQPDAVSQVEQDLKQAAQRDLGVSLSDDQAQQLTAWIGKWNEKYVTIDSVAPTYHIGFGTVVAGDNLATTGVTATLVAQEPVPPGRDVAILKADSGTVPALPLAAGNPDHGTQTFVIGYPHSDSLAQASPDSPTMTATMTSGKTVDTKLMAGWTAYGTAASVTYGNSGGPVLDAEGRVLGIMSFVPTNSQGQIEAGQGGYFVPVGVIREELQKASVKPAAGNLTLTYYQALSKSDIHRYREELPLLTTMQSGSVNEVYVKDDILAAQSAILSGKDQTPPKLTPYLPEAGAAAGVALLFMIVALAWPRRRPAAAQIAPVEPIAPAEAIALAGEPTLVASVPDRSDPGFR